MRPATHIWRAPRNAIFVRTIRVPFLDLRNQQQLMQLRLQPDAPGDPQLSLMPAAAGVQGLSVAYEPAVTGLVGDAIRTFAVSTITIQIDRATIQKLLPFESNGTEPGQEVTLAFDHLIALPGAPLLPLISGSFIIEPGVSIP